MPVTEILENVPWLDNSVLDPCNAVVIRTDADGVYGKIVCRLQIEDFKDKEIAIKYFHNTPISIENPIEGINGIPIEYKAKRRCDVMRYLHKRWDELEQAYIDHYDHD